MSWLCRRELRTRAMDEVCPVATLFATLSLVRWKAAGAEAGGGGGGRATTERAGTGMVGEHGCSMAVAR